MLYDMVIKLLVKKNLALPVLVQIHAQYNQNLPSKRKQNDVSKQIQRMMNYS